VNQRLILFKCSVLLILLISINQEQITTACRSNQNTVIHTKYAMEIAEANFSHEVSYAAYSRTRTLE